MGRRAKGEGSLYKTIQKQKRPKFASNGECAICKNCTDRTACNNRQGYEKCDKCKNCKEECLNTYYIQTLDDLDINQLRSVESVGITAGASTPNKIIEEVQNNVRINF